MFSAEDLTGELLDMRFSTVPTRLMKQAFGALPIVCVVREPYAWMTSVWMQDVHEGGSLSLRKFLTSPFSQAANPRFGLVQKAHFAKQIAVWQAEMGRENVLVLPYGLLLHDWDRFIASVYRHFGVDDSFRPPDDRRRVSPTPMALGVQRQANRLIATYHKHGGPIVSERAYTFVRRRLVPRLARILPCCRLTDARRAFDRESRRMLAAANRDLQESVAHDLAAFGYDLDV